MSRVRLEAVPVPTSGAAAADVGIISTQRRGGVATGAALAVVQVTMQLATAALLLRRDAIAFAVRDGAQALLRPPQLLSIATPPS